MERETTTTTLGAAMEQNQLNGFTAERGRNQNDVINQVNGYYLPDDDEDEDDEEDDLVLGDEDELDEDDLDEDDIDVEIDDDIDEDVDEDDLVLDADDDEDEEDENL